MTGTDDRKPSSRGGRGRGRGRDGGGRGEMSRAVQISKTLSKLLRHQAENEKIPITSDGWVRIDHLLAWRGLSTSGGRFNPSATVNEIWEVVEENEKKRFAVKYTDHKVESIESVEVGEQGRTSEQVEQNVESTTAHALAAFRSSSHPDTTLSHYYIRATQGHSMKAVESEALLTPITLDDPASIPVTVVHGTFYGAWESILRDGGLKSMGRNHVHFASGPALTEVLPSTAADDGGVSQNVIDDTFEKNKVISGMRKDAQILIYVNLKRCLEDVQTRKLDMKWWRSENGVTLTEGLEMSSIQEINHDIEGLQLQEQDENLVAVNNQEKKRRETWKNKGKQVSIQKIVPMSYWDVVVEVKAGLGILWKQGDGVIQELPDHLKSKGVPRGKSGGGGREGGRGKSG